MAINVEEALKHDEHMQEGFDVYQELDKKSNDVAEEISSTLIESIVKDSDKFNISTAVLAVSKSLSHLASYMYDTEEEFLSDIKKARATVVSDIIPALLDPQPCGNCMSCKNDDIANCENPIIRGEYTTSRFLPILCNMIIEYDLFNKILHMYTVGREEYLNNEKNETETKED